MTLFHLLYSMVAASPSISNFILKYSIPTFILFVSFRATPNGAQLLLLLVLHSGITLAGSGNHMLLQNRMWVTVYKAKTLFSVLLLCSHISSFPFYYFSRSKLFLNIGTDYIIYILSKIIIKDYIIYYQRFSLDPLKLIFYLNIGILKHSKVCFLRVKILIS